MRRPLPRSGLVLLASLILLISLPSMDAAAQGRDGPGDDGGRFRRGGSEARGARPLPFAVPPGLPTGAHVPENNPITAEKIELGRRLFFDAALSEDRTVSCATCHRPELAFADSTARSAGFLGRKGGRNTPTLLNRVYGRSFFWDGRAATLEEAVLMPVEDTLEMAMSLPRLLERIRSDDGYRVQFAAAFTDGLVTQENVARALATYVRTLVAGDSPFDRFRSGDSAAISERARRGRLLFFGRARCAQCHQGPNFSDERFESIGVPSTDAGRMGVTGSRGDRGEFKVPTLRDVARTAPYMHDGSLATLEAVVEFYDRGGGPGSEGRRRGRRDVRPLGLTAAERADLVAFLEALTSASATR